MFAQAPPPDFDVRGRRGPGERPELVAEVGLIEIARATGEVAPWGLAPFLPMPSAAPSVSGWTTSK